jgi:DNA-binding response OmpR family regulator
MDEVGSTDVFMFEGFRFDRAGDYLFRVNGPRGAEPIALGSRALALLGLLLDRQGQLVTKDEIFGVVWSGMAIEEANLTVQISALRRHSGSGPRTGKLHPNHPWARLPVCRGGDAGRGRGPLEFHVALRR